jgi:hypothetical protein
VWPIERAAGALYASGPEPVGARRLRSLLLDPSAPEPSGLEAWSLLPAPERVEGSWYAAADGQPLLLVATTRADKVGIFEKLKFRVLPLRGDRTRGGHPPGLAVETATRRWYQVEPRLADHDGDGRDDLVLLQPEGLGAGHLVLEVYRGRGGGRFSTPAASRSAVELRGEEGAWSWGADLTGDGRPDLAGVDRDRLLIFAGEPGGSRRVLRTPAARILSWKSLEGARPQVEVALGTAGMQVAELAQPSGRPRALDLDGDGLAEILFGPAEVRGRSVVAVLRLRD